MLIDHLYQDIQQSSDIKLGVDREDNKKQGAGDQGLMFGYATDETEVLMPAPIFYSHKLVEKQAMLLKEKKVFDLGFFFL